MVISPRCDRGGSGWAVTESRPAHHDGEPPTAADAARARRHPWRRRILLSLGLLLTTAVVVLAVLAATYQPIRFGDSYGGDFPGLPHGTGLRSVNTFAGATGEIYVPPQSGVFSVIPSIYNNGPGRHQQGGQPVIAAPVSGSKKYRRAGSTVKVTRPPGLTPVCGSILAMPMGALPTRMAASAASSAAAAAAAAWAAGVASSQK
jgi:hypothetical protein